MSATTRTLRALRRHRALTVGLCAVGLVACSAAADGPDPTTTVTTVASDPSAPVTNSSDPVDPSAPSTIGGVGNLPGPLPTEAIEEIASTTTLPPPEEAVGTLANGNRILLLGDSILASTARRYTNNMCQVLVPLGWQVELEAEVSRGIDFGQRVQRELKDQHWDVGLIFLGNNYNNDQDDFYKRYNDVIVGFGDIPVVVVTVSEAQESKPKVNEIIRALAGAHPNVTVLDWASISRYPGVINENDSLHMHLTDTGREVLAEAVGDVLGIAPAQPGDCLKSKHTDDSAGSVNGSGGSSGGGGSGGGSGSHPTTTVKSTGTTVKPTTSSTSPVTTTGGCQIPPCGPTSTNPPTGSTSPPSATTNPPATNPPATSPPATNPPATNPPATNPPVTVTVPGP